MFSVLPSAQRVCTTFSSLLLISVPQPKPPTSTPKRAACSALKISVVPACSTPGGDHCGICPPLMKAW